MQNQMRFRRIGTNLARELFDSIVQSGIQLALGPRLVRVYCDEDLAIFRDPDAYGAGIDPDLGCEVRLRRGGDPSCSCEVAHAFGLCEHSVGAWVLLREAQVSASPQEALAA